MRRMILDLANRRVDEMMEVQIIYLIACIVAFPVVDLWAVALGYALVQVSEVIGLQMVRGVFTAATDPRDMLEGQSWPVVRYELISAFAVSAALMIAFMHIDPTMRLGVIAVWCLGMIYFVFPTMYCERSLYGCITVHTVMMLISIQICHVLMVSSPPEVLLANTGLCILAGVMAAFIGRQVRADYLRHLERERDLGELVCQLDRENAQKTDFVGHLSHELRTPLNGLMGTVALLRLALPGPEHAQHLDVMTRSGRTLVQLLNDSLDLSRLEANALMLDTSATSVRDMIEEQTSLHRANAIEKGLDLIIDIEENVPEILLVDSIRLMQCLGNMIANAIKFSETGSITVQADFDPNAASPILYLHVADQGIGIAAAKQSAIFKPFAQVDTSITRPHMGAGLGLAISRRLARLMGGDVEVQSIEGQGSKFTISVVAVPV